MHYYYIIKKLVYCLREKRLQLLLNIGQKRINIFMIQKEAFSMRKRTKRVISIVMAALMVLSVMPVSSLSGIWATKVEAAEALAYEGLDLTKGMEPGKTYGGSLGLQSVSTDKVGYSEENKDIEGVTYPGYLKITDNTDADGSKTKIPTKSAYKITPDKDGDMSIAFKLNAGKSFYMVKADGTEVATVNNGGTASAFYYKTYSLKAGETYYMYAGKNKLFLYGVEWNGKAETAEKVKLGVKEQNQVEDTYNGKVTFLSGFKVNSDGNDKFTETFDGTNNSIKLDKDKGGKYSTANLFKDAKSTTLNDNLNDSSKEFVINKGGIKFVADENGSVSVDVRINKSSETDNKPFYVISYSPADKYELVEYKSVSATAYETIDVDVKAGYTYYFGQAGSDMILFNMRIVKGTIYDTTPWDEVAAPKITDVRATSDGFEVDVEGNINKYTGAENIYVTMLHNGGEAGEANITNIKGSTTVNFTAYENGEYTFVATAQRTGSPDKSSEVYSSEKTQNFILGVKKPTITWAQNKGNGTVYLDWVNISDASDYTVTYKAVGEDDAAAKTVTDIKTGDCIVTGLTAGTEYVFNVVANRADGQHSETASKTVKVSDSEDQNWYVSTIGSAQATTGKINYADGTTQAIALASGDNAKTKADTVAAGSIANTTGSIDIDSQSSGKISDDEDGFSYYYTKIDPEKENFELTATFEITNVKDTPDNQTGFGIVAADTLGVNNWGAPGYVYKYFNYFSSMMFSSKYDAPTMRYITGYTSSDTSNKDGVERVNNNDKFSELKSSDFFKEGAKYTFTVKKTDEGYEATATTDKGTQTKKINENALTSVQEDGTVCVGIMVSRKVGVHISDVSFSKSESKGLVTGETKEDKITPSVRVYSSNTCGADEYEYIGVPNCAGELTLVSSSSKESVVKNVSADEVVRVNLPVSVGQNTITATFKPAAADNIVSDKVTTTTTTVTRKVYGESGQTIIVSPDGTKDGHGTEASPLDINTAVSYAQPGQTILMKNGVYEDWINIARSVSGTADKNINLVAESISTNGTDGVVISGAGIKVTGSYWHIYGLYVKDSTGVGIQVSGNNNTIDMCTVNHAANSGVQISRDGGADNYAGIQGRLWPSDNLIKNCESFDNCDPGRNDADGFAAKLTCGEGNSFYGCISHNNIDDGWDLYAKSVTGMIGAVTIENCVAYNNGWLTTDDITAKDYNYGEGNGFKLGGGYLKGGHKLINSVTFGNHAKGITSNSCPDISITSCTAYGNGNSSSYSVGLNTMTSMLKEWKVSGLISMSNSKLTGNADLIPFSQHSEDNYIYNGETSYNNLGQEASDAWFESVDIKTVPTRNANGTIDMKGLLTVKDGAPINTNVGARLDVTSDKAISVRPEVGSTVAANHSYGEWTTVKAATCTEDGTEQRVCSVCGDVETRTIKAAGHQYGEWTTVKAATCTEDGTEQRVCSVCGDVETRTIKALGHEYSKEYTVDKEATTSEEGSKSLHCIHEGCTSKADITVIPKVKAPEKEVVKSSETAGDMKESVKITESSDAGEIFGYTEEEVASINTGAKVDIIVSVDESTATVSTEDKENVKNAIESDKNLKEAGYNVESAMFLDIKVSKKVGDMAAVNITNTLKPLTFEITLSDKLINKDDSMVRTYKVVRIHDGKTTILDAVYDSTTNKITFNTDKFSTYAIIYNDVKKNTEDSTGTKEEPTTKPTTDSTVKPTDSTVAPSEDASTVENTSLADAQTGNGSQTGDSTNVALYVILAVICVAALIGVVVYDKKKKQINK